MKVNVDMTVEVSDARRKQIAESLGLKAVDRQGIKDFLWEHGAGWEAVLDGEKFEEDAANVNGTGDEVDDVLGSLPVDVDDLLAAAEDEDLI